MAEVIWTELTDKDASLVHPSVLSVSATSADSGESDHEYSKEEVLDAWDHRFGRSPERSKLYDMIIQLFLRRVVDLLEEESLPVFPMRAKTYFDSATADTPRMVLTAEEHANGITLTYEERRERANKLWDEMDELAREPYFKIESDEIARFHEECRALLGRLHERHGE